MRQNLYGVFFRFFASLRLTVAVLSSLAAACLVGMFWDQTLSLEEHLGQLVNSPTVIVLFQFLELNDVFHSWWFSLLTLFLALNLTACSIERLPKIWLDIRHPLKIPSDFQLARMPNRFLWHTSSLSEAIEKIRGFSGKKTEVIPFRNKITFLFSQRHIYARCGVYIVHISLLIIMFGSIATTTFGIDGLVAIEEGAAERIIQVKGPGGLRYPHDLGFWVDVSDFRLQTFTDNSPMAYESDLRIMDPEATSNPASQKTIRVNEPLFYKGYTFYQASYQQMAGDAKIKLGVARHTQSPKEVIVKIGEPITLDAKTNLVVLKTVDDYGGLGEAVQLQQISNQENANTFYVFRQYPNFDPFVRRGEWDIFYHGKDAHYATGISVAKVPFLPFVFAGFIGLFIGMYMAFLQSQRRYYAKIVERKDGFVDVVVAGISHRHIHAFAEEFKQIEKGLCG